MALVPHQRGRRSMSDLAVRLTGDLRQIHLAWTAPSEAETFVIHGRPMQVAPRGARPLSGPQVLAEVSRADYLHGGLSVHGETWEYVVRGLDRDGVPCAQSSPMSVTSKPSVTVTGRAVATVGSFDGVSSELALAGRAYVRYQSTFPRDVDFHHGRDEAATQWSWLHPGPEDAWAGRRTHSFRLHFDLAGPPRSDFDFAVWLTDRHPSRAGAASVWINDILCDPVIFAGPFDADLSGPELQSDLPGRGSGPAYFERPLPHSLLRAGENCLEIVKDQGSWIAYDAVGIFARS
ncbi:polysaccharide lyase family protein [Demetria terragena]|uniref:polysaccharide lyase family protein n=1 Tax=Demetria terragena TaxID=63959 RepID=UPI000373AD7D|nr:polysaccharide lyase family protein [Demetria terragena]